MSETKLKPCPFCSRDELHGQSCIKCSNCGAQSGWHENDKDAIAAWNTRPLEDELLEALKEFVESAQSWHDFHKHDSGIQCDRLCAAIPAGNAAIDHAKARQ